MDGLFCKSQCPNGHLIYLRSQSGFHMSAFNIILQCKQISTILDSVVRPRENDCEFGTCIKAGFYLKMSGKSDFLILLYLARSTIGLHIGKTCFGVFSKF